MTWFDNSINTKIRGLPDSNGSIGEKLTIFKDLYSWKTTPKQQTDWYKFQMAAKNHLKDGLKVLEPAFEYSGFDL